MENLLKGKFHEMENSLFSLHDILFGSVPSRYFDFEA